LQASQREVHVDHFIPRARVPNDSFGDFVATHDKCNRNKLDHLVAFEFLDKWINRNITEFNELNEISLKYTWPIDAKNQSS
jgi:CRISPR/Cas system Type II protein with McrA/HNH and RuvC-like nuclease domain